jgi:transcriptional regulator with XRE-family HTH domain
MSIATAFGRVLRRLRLEACMKQEQLGLEADLQRKFISLLELGEKQPTITSVFKLAAALQIKPGKIIALTDAELNGQ